MHPNTIIALTDIENEMLKYKKKYKLWDVWVYKGEKWKLFFKYPHTASADQMYQKCFDVFLKFEGIVLVWSNIGHNLAYVLAFAAKLHTWIRIRFSCELNPDFYTHKNDLFMRNTVKLLF